MAPMMEVVEHERERPIPFGFQKLKSIFNQSKVAKSCKEQSFAAKKERVTRFSEHLKSIRTELTEELATYQTYSATQDEFERIFECLGSLDEIQSYLTRRTELVATFFPLNMPLYALCLYALMPALVADEVYVRAPQRMTTLMKRLLPLLQVGFFFPNISVVFMGREEFVQAYITRADVIIFTGKLSNAQHVLSQTKRNSLFLFNGWGCNPIVIGDGADLEAAATKTIDARLFCSGQDCAAPDTILVRQDQVSDFVESLKRQLAQVKVGDYHDQDVRVGKLADHNQLHHLSLLLLKYNSQIVSGGFIDYHASIVYPTIIVAPLNEKVNYEELFAPIFIISVYDHDSQLAEYFDHPKYIENDMYVSLFGSSPYVRTLKKSILLYNQVVFDTDRGNDAFGGYSMGASFVSANRNIVPKPVLVPRDIFHFLDGDGLHQKLTPGLQKKIGKRVSQATASILGDNLVLAFLYGSIAEGTATRNSDINIFVVLKHKDLEQLQIFQRWIEDYHLQVNLRIKMERSVDIFTHDELEAIISSLVNSNEALTLQQLQRTHLQALLGAQRGVTGNKDLAIRYRHLIQARLKVAEVSEILENERIPRKAIAS